MGGRSGKKSLCHGREKYLNCILPLSIHNSLIVEGMSYDFEYEPQFYGQYDSVPGMPYSGKMEQSRARELEFSE